MRAEVGEMLKEYILSNEDYETIRDLMTEDMDRGLSKETNHEATVRMLVTYVLDLPDGMGECS